jgi:hypothetical protein
MNTGHVCLTCSRQVHHTLYCTLTPTPTHTQHTKQSTHNTQPNSMGLQARSGSAHGDGCCGTRRCPAGRVAQHLFLSRLRLSLNSLFRKVTQLCVLMRPDRRGERGSVLEEVSMADVGQPKSAEEARERPAASLTLLVVVFLVTEPLPAKCLRVGESYMSMACRERERERLVAITIVQLTCA